MSNTRTDCDSLGEVTLPADVVYGAHTHRAIQNFPITDVKLSHFPDLVCALAMVKKAAAMANRDLNELSPQLAKPIIATCDEIIAGEHHEHFVVDMVQGGAGTSTNMNANEVIANLALRKLGYGLGAYEHLHPNDHVNRSQSTNDVYPTAIRLAVLRKCDKLVAEQRRLSAAFADKARAFDHVMKVGRTQLQDAVPITLGSEFKSFATTLGEDVERVDQLKRLLLEVNLGGTAVGTGINTPKGYGEVAVAHLADISGYELVAAADLIEASSDLGAFVTFSGVLKRIAVKLSKVCNDLRLLSSGPRAGIGEIVLPPVQAGSSIMPGKVNPVIPEVVNQVAFQVIGNDLTVTMAAEGGQLQLNAFEPVIIYKVLESMRVLSRAMAVLTDRCVVGIEADEARCEALLNGSLIFATALVPKIGYDRAAKIAKLAHARGITIREAADEIGGISQEDLDNAFRPDAVFGHSSQ